MDETIIEGTELFAEKLEELKIRKQELIVKMSESKFKRIVLGSVCGIIGALQGFAEPRTFTSVLTGTAAFAAAVYQAFQIENMEVIFDQSGMKYLAIAEKRIYK